MMVAPRQSLANSDLLGAEYGFTLGGTSGPFRTDYALYFNGFLDLPITKSDPLFGQKFMAELMFGHSRSRATVPPIVFSGVTITDFEITTFQVLLGGKYKFDKLGEPGSVARRFQPYLTLGVLFNLFLCRTNERTDSESACGAGPLPPELGEKGVPVGGGDVRFDYSLGGGVDFLLASQFFVGVALRQSFSSADARYTMFGGTAGFLF
ncbi:MAG: hypothetical protein AB1451_00725 [Nitrospirota bacterium]